MGDSGYLAAANPCLSGDLSGASERSSGSYYFATEALISSARAFAAVTAEMARGGSRFLPGGHSRNGRAARRTDLILELAGVRPRGELHGRRAFYCLRC